MIRFRVGLGFLAVLFAVQGERAVVANGPTFDEAAHFAAGYSYWHTSDFRLNVEDPPLAKLLWTAPQFLFDPIPFAPDAAEWDGSQEWVIGNRVLFESGRSWESLLRPARRINLLFGVGVVLLVGLWARQLTGDSKSGLVAAACAAFDPNLVAHSAILSTDAAMTLATVLTTFAAWRYLSQPTSGRLNATGIVLGLALGAKFSAVALVVAMALGLLAFVFAGGSCESPAAPRWIKRLRSLFAPIVRVTTLALGVVALLYFVVELPSWGYGLKYQLVREQFNDASYFFLGEVSNSGWLLYFPVTMACKLPCGLLLLAGVGLLLRRPKFDPPTAFLTVCASALFFAFVFAKVNLGIRIVLPILPFIYLLAARSLTGRTWRQPVALFGIGWMAISAYQTSPFPLTYFNEFVRTPSRTLGDSNLDWGQGLPALKEYLDRENAGIIYLSYCGTAPPEAFGIRAELLPGYGRIGPPTGEHVPENALRVLLAISVGNEQGTYLKPHDLYHWLEAYTPVAQLAGGSIRVYDFTGDAEVIVRLRALSNGAE